MKVIQTTTATSSGGALNFSPDPVKFQNELQVNHDGGIFALPLDAACAFCLLQSDVSKQICLCVQSAFRYRHTLMDVVCEANTQWWPSLWVHLKHPPLPFHLNWLNPSRLRNVGRLLQASDCKRPQKPHFTMRYEVILLIADLWQDLHQYGIKSAKVPALLG